MPKSQIYLLHLAARFSPVGISWQLTLKKGNITSILVELEWLRNKWRIKELTVSAHQIELRQGTIHRAALIVVVHKFLDRPPILVVGKDRCQHFIVDASLHMFDLGFHCGVSLLVSLRVSLRV